MSASRRILVPLAALLACLPGFAQAQERIYAATMDGASNLPDPIKTPAAGAVQLVVSPDGKSIAYKVTVDQLSNPTAADLHLGSTSQNGPLVVKLWPAKGVAPKKGPVSGVLAEGRFDAGDLQGPMTGVPLADLIEELAAGNVYTHVHTSDGSDPPNSGPGDYRLGEIRGQMAAK